MNTATISVFIPGLPMGKERHRDGEHRTPERTRDFQARVAYVVKQAACGLQQFDGLVETRITVVWPRPSTRPRFVTPETWGDGRRVFSTGRFDLDNVTKAVWDGVNQSGVWADDRWVCRGRENQVFASVGEAPGVELVLSAVDANVDRPPPGCFRPEAPPPVLAAVL